MSGGDGYLVGVILAAGFGTRLSPLTDDTPKPLLDVGGRPVASHLVTLLRTLPTLDRIVVVTNGLHGDQWAQWQLDVGYPPPIQVESNGVQDNDDRAGAVADLGRALAAVDHDGAYVVLAGDNLLDESLAAHVAARPQHDGAVVLCRDLGDDVPPGRFGEVTCDADGVVTRFREKPAEPESPLVATCSYVLPPDAPTLVRDYLVEGGDPDAPGSFIGWLAERRTVVARPLTGRYFDIGNIETLEAARAAHR